MGIALVSAAWALFNVVFIPFVLSLWLRRFEPLLKARSPRLCVLMGVAQLITANLVFCQEILLRKYHICIPPSVIIWISSTMLAFIISPVILRTRRVIVMTKPELKRDSQLLQGLTFHSQMKVIAAFLAGYSAISIFAEICRAKGLRSVNFNFVYQPCSLYFFSTASSLPLLYKDAVSLVRARDSLGMGSELVRAIGAVCVFILPYYAVVSLNNFGVMHVDTRAQFMMVAAIVFFMGDAFIVSRLKWARFDCHTNQIDIDEEITQSYRRWPDSLVLISDPVLSPLYAQHVTRRLCYESYRFVVDVAVYERQCNDPKCTLDEQYRLFREIVESHIEQSSAMEINVGSNMRTPILACMKEAVYTSLPFDERQLIFSECRQEICRILDLNLMRGFRKTAEFTKAANRILGQRRKSDTESDMMAILRLV